MKAWYFNGSVDPSGLELREASVPEPGPGELLTRVHAASLNRGEFIANPRTAGGAPKAAGIEAAGEVVKVGEGVTSFRPGDRVMGRAKGGFAEYALHREGDAMPVPQALSWEEAAALSIAFLVAYDMLWPGGALRKDEWLLVAGVTAGVGVATLQLAKLIGARVIGTSGSAEKLAKLSPLGLDVGLPGRGPGFEPAVLEATSGKGVDLVVNNVGGSVFAECIRCLAYRGRLAMVGHVDKQAWMELDILAVHAKCLTLFGVSNKLRSAAELAGLVQGFTRDVMPAVAHGTLRPVIDSSFAFGDLPEARACMEANRHVGKVVLRF